MEKGLPIRKTSVNRWQAITTAWLFVTGFIFFIGLADAATAQVAAGNDMAIEGTVRDGSGNPLPGVTVIVQGTTTGATTDADGHYRIPSAADTGTLVFTYIGYQTLEVPVQGKTTIDVQLTASSTSLNQVVVIGYGTEKKVNVIGSVSTISNKELTASPVSNISSALAGRLPGAVVQQGNGEPGKNAASLLVRGMATLGDNTPLVVVDGIPGRDLNTINANDVASISLLKDASAAIYGARAANGVILVTTKRGRENTPATFNYSFYQGMVTPTTLPEMADAATYAKMIRESQSYSGVDESNMTFSLEDIEKYKSGEYPWTHPNTNWYKETLAKYGSTSNHNFSVTGGSQSISYYAAFGAHYDGSIYKSHSTRFSRYDLKANVDIQINRYFSVGVDINESLEKGKYPSVGSSSIYQGIIRGLPTTPAYYPNGLPGPDIERGDQPAVTSTFKTGFDDNRTYKSYNTLRAEFKVPWVEGLSLSSYYAYDISLNKEKLFQKPWTLYQLDQGAYLAAGNTGKEDGSDFLVGSSKGVSDPALQDNYGYIQTNTFNLKVNYEKTFNEAHHLSVFAAYENSVVNNGGIGAYRRYFISDELPYLFAGGDAEKDNSETVGVDARVNYFGRLSYDYKGTYLFQFSFRRDGSLRFSKESGRWGNFPSVLGGWIVSNENFWKEHVHLIDFFKLKASWGQMGNDLVPPFQYLTTYEFGTGMVLGANPTYSASLQQVGAPNPNITWEVANMYNAGFESLWFDSKLTLNADFFYERRSRILVQRNASVPAFTGITLPDENFGIVDSKGFELELGYRSNTSFGLSYGIQGNLAFARNKVIEFDEPERSVPWQVQTGHPQGAALLYKAIGIFHDEDEVNRLPHVPGARPGDIILDDVDGDGEITSDDRILFPRTTTPEVTYGINLNLGYKSWSLTALVQGASNTMRKIYYDLQGTSGNYFAYDADGRWTPNNPDASKPRTFNREDEYWRSAYESDYYYHNVAFMRLKNLQLAYTLPQPVIEKLRMKQAQVYLSGENMWLIYSGNRIMDPELGDILNYPIMKVFAVGATITF